MSNSGDAGVSVSGPRETGALVSSAAGGGSGVSDSGEEGMGVVGLEFVLESRFSLLLSPTFASFSFSCGVSFPTVICINGLSGVALGGLRTGFPAEIKDLC